MKVRNRNRYFAQVPDDVLYAEIGAQAVRLYAVLWRKSMQAGEGRPVGVSKKELADSMHVKSRDTVIRSLQELETLGAVEVTKQRTPHGDKPDLITLLEMTVSTSRQGGVDEPTPEGVDGSTAQGVDEQTSNKEEKREVEEKLTADGGEASKKEPHPTRRTDLILEAVIPSGADLPRKFVGHLAREIKGLLEEKKDLDKIIIAARHVVNRGISPGTLASVYVQAKNGTLGKPFKPGDTQNAWEGKTLAEAVAES